MRATTYHRLGLLGVLASATLFAPSEASAQYYDRSVPCNALCRAWMGWDRPQPAPPRYVYREVRPRYRYYEEQPRYRYERSAPVYEYYYVPEYRGAERFDEFDDRARPQRERRVRPAPPSRKAEARKPAAPKAKAPKAKAERNAPDRRQQSASIAPVERLKPQSPEPPTPLLPAILPNEAGRIAAIDPEAKPAAAIPEIPAAVPSPATPEIAEPSREAPPAPVQEASPSPQPESDPPTVAQETEAAAATPAPPEQPARETAADTAPEGTDVATAPVAEATPEADPSADERETTASIDPARPPAPTASPAERPLEANAPDDATQATAIPETPQPDPQAAPDTNVPDDKRQAALSPPPPPPPPAPPLSADSQAEPRDALTTMMQEDRGVLMILQARAPDPDFRGPSAKLGDALTSEAPLTDLPDEIVERMPSFQGLKFAVVNGDAYLVSPISRRVLKVFRADPADAAREQNSTAGSSKR